MTDKNFWKATGVRCARTFLSTILGVWTGGQLITEIDWKTTLVSALSSTVFIFLLCLRAGLPEVKMAQSAYMDAEEPLDSFIGDGEMEVTDGEE